nr:hypothetical protein [Pseudoxanthomonas sp.]
MAWFPSLPLIRRLRRPRVRARMAWLGVWALLLQQLALVAYACPLEAPVEPARVMAGCEGMTTLDPDAPALCHQHCQRDHVAAPDIKSPQVPSLAAAPPLFGVIEAQLPPAPAQHYRDIPVCQSDPPPAQRFCSLQI